MGFETSTAPPAPIALPPYPSAASLSYYDLPVAELSPVAMATEPRAHTKLGPNIWAAIGWSFGWLFANFFLSYTAYFFVSYAGEFFGAPVDFANIYSNPWAVTILIGFSSCSGAITALLATSVHARRNIVERLGLRLPRLHHWGFAILALFPAAILGIEAAAVVNEFSVGSFQQVNRSVIEMNSVPALAVLIFCCVFPGVFEEILMRGVIGKSLIERFGVWGGVAITSILFGIPHYNPSHIASAAVMGVFLHLMFIYSRSLFVPMTIHAVNNVIAFFGARMQDGATAVSSEPSSNHIGPALLIATVCASLTLVLCWRRFRAKPTHTTSPGTSDIPLATLAKPSKPREWRWLLFLGLAITHLIFYALLFGAPSA